MNRIFFSILLVAGLSYALGSCSSGAYVANPSANANGSINPLNPLKASQFTWTGNGGKLSLNINGSPWSTDSAYVVFVDSIQANVVYGWGGGKYIIMYIQYGYAGNLYNMGFKQYNNMADWAGDSASIYNPYQSVLGNSGELYMTANDTLNFAGKFYFQAANSSGDIDNITDGIFTLTKY